jgi:hmp protein
MAVCHAISRQVGVFPIRNLLSQFTGSISILAMSACMILAMRPKILETPLGGLDKIYRLHKWFGLKPKDCQLIILYKAFRIVKLVVYGSVVVAALQIVLLENLRHAHYIKSCLNSAKWS